MEHLTRITADDAHYFFGYYDKWQFDVSDRYALGMKADFMDRPPRVEDAIEIGMIDRQDEHRWIPLDRTTAWCWQQGCMLQWLGASDSEIIYNVRGAKRYEARIRNVISGHTRRVDRAIYTVHPNGREAIGVDFARIGHLRPGYGYAGFEDPNESASAPDDTGLWRIDLETGTSELIVTIAQIAALNPPDTAPGSRHWFNHILYNTDGSRLIFLHRWELPPDRFRGRMYTCNPDGSALHLVSDATNPNSWNASHFWWRDPQTIIVWASTPGTKNDGAYVIVQDRTGRVTELDRHQLHCDGHMSFTAPGSDWLLSDTYPDAKNKRTLFLYNIEQQKRMDVARLDDHATLDECRCDLHPRLSRDGANVCIDSAHEGQRAMYLLNIGHIARPS